jgi:hypothetical protein
MRSIQSHAERKCSTCAVLSAQAATVLCNCGTTFKFYIENEHLLLRLAHLLAGV